MLQKSKTKYGYVRKLAALPLTFAVAFAYLVNAKNTEIRTTNREIETIIRNMDLPVSDTVRNNSTADSLVALQQKKIEAAAEKLRLNSTKGEELKKEATKKFEELEALRNTKGTGSEEYRAKLDDIRKIGNQMDRIAGSKIVRKTDMTDQNWKSISRYFDDIRQDSVRSRIGKAVKDFRIFTLPDMNVDTLVSNVGNIEVFTNPDGRKSIILRSRAGKSAMVAGNHIFKIDKGEFPQLKTFRTESGKTLSKKERRKLDNLNRKQQKLDQERRAILKEKGLTYGLSGVHFQDFPKITEGPLSYSYSYQTSSPKEYKGMISSTNSNIKIFINGKASTRDEVNKLNPSDIESININKNNQSGEIHIKTK